MKKNINKCETMKAHLAEKTITELKHSIDNIEKMIEKSQALLKSSRPLHPRQVRTDSIELAFHSSSNEMQKSIQQESLSSNTIVFRNENKKIKFPQRKKLFIDTNLLDKKSEDFSINDNILIQEQLTPVAKMPITRPGFLLDQFFAKSISPISKGNRVRTEALNSSWEKSTLNDSLDRKSDFKLQKEPIKILIKKEKIRRNQHSKKLSDLQILSNKRPRVFVLKPNKGKYSYYRKAPMKQTKQNQSIQAEKSPTKTDWSNAAPTNQKQCERHEKANEQKQMGQFLKKVKQHEFINRYLSEKEVCCIYEYLKRSQIPEYKWPLFVVNEVFEKVKISKNGL